MILYIEEIRVRQNLLPDSKFFIKNLKKHVKKIIRDSSRDTPLAIVVITDKENHGNMTATEKMRGKETARPNIQETRK